MYLEKKARDFALKAHKNQYRKDGVTPYFTHIIGVVALLRGIGITDENTLCAAYLHDVIEDCNVTREKIEKEFNSEVARIVSALTRDVSREEYKKRIGKSDYKVQLIKLADTTHNCSTLHPGLKKKTIRNKIKDCKSFYLPLAKKIAPDLYAMMREYIQPFLK